MIQSVRLLDREADVAHASESGLFRPWSLGDDDAMPSVSLPPELHARGATLDDIDRITELTQRCERHDIGEVVVTREDVEADMCDPETNVGTDDLLVFDGDSLVGYVFVPGWRAEGEVDPDHRGRGIGSALVDWMEERALVRAPVDAEVRVGQTKFDGCTGAIDLFRSRGYEVRHTSWVLYFPPGVQIVDRRPTGVEIRPATDADLRAAYRVNEDAFNEWPNRTPRTYESWRAHTVERSDFESDLLRVAESGSEIVGMCYAVDALDEGWVDAVAVRRDHRGAGIAQALLASTYLELRRRGRSRLGLSTDSRTGALDLYLRLGIEVDKTFQHWSKLLRPATEPAP